MSREKCNWELLDFTKTKEFKKLSKLKQTWIRIKIAFIEAISYF